MAVFSVLLGTLLRDRLSCTHNLLSARYFSSILTREVTERLKFAKSQITVSGEDRQDLHQSLSLNLILYPFQNVIGHVLKRSFRTYF